MSGARLLASIDAVRERLAASGLFRDVRSHLDFYDLDEVLKDSFRPPAARIVLGKAKPELRPDGGRDILFDFVIVIIAGREGRPDPAFASADAAAMALLIDVMQLVAGEPYFGQAAVGPAEIGDARVALSEKNSNSGFAVTVLELSWRLLSVIAAYDPVSAVFDATRPAPAPGLSVNGDAEIDP